jgi:hypothetical protein
MTMRRAPLLFLFAAGLLGGCINRGPFPSLAQRPGETLPIEEPVRTAAAVPNDPALRARIAELTGAARQGARAFDEAFSPAERLARKAGVSGSDSWVEAQQALSRLEASRGDTMTAAAELDQLNRARANQPTSAEDQAAIDAAIAEMDRTAAGQQARIDRLKALIDH